MNYQIVCAFYRDILMNIRPSTILYVHKFFMFSFNSLIANPTKWSNTLKQFVGNVRGWHLKG